MRTNMLVFVGSCAARRRTAIHGNARYIGPRGLHLRAVCSAAAAAIASTAPQIPGKSTRQKERAPKGPLKTHYAVPGGDKQEKLTSYALNLGRRAMNLSGQPGKFRQSMQFVGGLARGLGRRHPDRAGGAALP